MFKKISVAQLLITLAAAAPLLPAPALAAPDTASSLSITSVTRLGPSDPGGADIFGSNVAIQGNVAVVGAADADDFQGAAYVFERVKGVWVERAKLVADDRTPFSFSEFGENTKISGKTIAIGAPGDQDGIGAVYIYQQTGDVWIQQAKLTANDGTVGSFFADSIALSDDLLVSGADVAPVGADDAGAAYLFRRSGTTWTQEAKLIASNQTNGAGFGSGTAIDSKDSVVIGAAAASSSGLVYFFKRVNGAWLEQSRLAPSSPEPGQAFGINIDASGNLLVVGAYGAVGIDGFPTGAAYVYRRSGAAWKEEARLVPSETQVRFFGVRVGISDETIVAGAPFTDTFENLEGGSAWVFQRSGKTWEMQAKLQAPDGTPRDNFGGYAAIDGMTILIGAELADSSPTVSDDEGAAYVFDLAGK